MSQSGGKVFNTHTQAHKAIYFTSINTLLVSLRQEPTVLCIVSANSMSEKHFK